MDRNRTISHSNVCGFRGRFVIEASKDVCGNVEEVARVSVTGAVEPTSSPKRQIDKIIISVYSLHIACSGRIGGIHREQHAKKSVHREMVERTAIRLPG